MWVLQFKWKEKRKRSENHFWLYFISKGFKFCFIAVRFFFVNVSFLYLKLCFSSLFVRMEWEIRSTRLYKSICWLERAKKRKVDHWMLQRFMKLMLKSSRVIAFEKKTATNAKSKQSLKLKAKHIVSIFIKCFSNFLHFLWLLYGGGLCSFAASLCVSVWV